MSTQLDLEYGEDQEAVRAAVNRFCEQLDAVSLARQSNQPFPRELWGELAALGVFQPATPAHPEAGGALEVCAIAESLGEHAFPGPLGATYTAIQVVDADTAARVASGASLVSLRPAGATLLPFGPAADVFLATEGDSLLTASLDSALEIVDTLGGDLCARATLRLDTHLPNSERGLALGKIADSAYLGGAAQRLITLTAEHAATRRQFGKALGDFQAVSHPLADCTIAVTAARMLARNAACRFDSTVDSAAAECLALATAALLSAARAARGSAFACHQIFGALGVTLEGPLFHYTRRIQQIISTRVDPNNDTERVLARVL